MSDACCTHSTVQYRQNTHEGGTKSDSWFCSSCNTEFRPMAERAETWRLLQELYWCTSVLARGVDRITTPDNFFGRWNDASAAVERRAAHFGVPLDRDDLPRPRLTRA